MGNRKVKIVSVLILSQFLFGFCTIASAAETNNCQHDKDTFRCVKFIKNYDADTITVNIPNVHPLIGEKVSVRVLGIDSPEIKGKNKCEKDKARIAQRLVENLLKNAKHIELQNVQRDKYFRILADVVADGKSIKDLVIKNHLAYKYEGGTKINVDWCNRLPASK
jgi:micrococcal nuclease